MKFHVRYMPAKAPLLLVDAAQGVQAQTMANFYLAFDQDLTIVPVMNKIDMANADPERVDKEMKHFLILIRIRNYYVLLQKWASESTEILNCYYRTHSRTRKPTDYL